MALQCLAREIAEELAVDVSVGEDTYLFRSDSRQARVHRHLSLPATGIGFVPTISHEHKEVVLFEAEAEFAGQPAAGLSPVDWPGIGFRKAGSGALRPQETPRTGGPEGSGVRRRVFRCVTFVRWSCRSASWLQCRFFSRGFFLRCSFSSFFCSLARSLLTFGEGIVGGRSSGVEGR